MDNSCYASLLGNFPGLAVVATLDGSILYCNQGAHELLIATTCGPVVHCVADLFACEILASRVAALQDRLTESEPESETLYPDDAPGLSAPVHVSVYMAKMVKSESVVVIQLSILAQQNISDILPPASGDSESRLLEKRYKVLTALNDITVRMMDHQPLHELLQNMAELVLELTNASSSFIHIVKGDDEWLELVAMSGIEIAELGRRLEKGVGLAGHAWLTAQVEYVEDYQRFSARVSSLDSITQACALPMIIDDRVVGVLGITYSDFQEAITNQLDLLQHFSTLASIAVENSLLLENARREAVRNRIMNELGTVVFKTDSFDELLETTAETVLAILGGGTFGVWRLDKRGGLCSVAGWVGDDAKISRQLIAEVETDRQVVLGWINEHHQIDHSKVKSPEYAALDELVVNARVSAKSFFIPCLGEEGGGYIFYVTIVEGHLFTENIRSLLGVIGNQFSTVAHRQTLQREVNFKAYHDGLTTLPNRIQFDLSLKETLSLAKSKNQQFAVLFIDLDGFKAVNDSMGHETGDKLLVKVAQRFRRVLDETWVLARIGGDEFAAIVWTEDYAMDVLSISNRLLKCLHGSFSLDKYVAEVGASIGASIYPSDGATASELLRNADSAMYEAKRAGKNCIRLFSDLDEGSDRWMQEQRSVA